MPDITSVCLIVSATDKPPKADEMHTALVKLNV